MLLASKDPVVQGSNEQLHELGDSCSTMLMPMQRNELETEEEYLRKEGFSEDHVEQFVAQDKDPIITGVY